MTCVIGLETPSGVILGCDSAATANWNVFASRLKKVFRQGEFLIGYTTRFRMGQVLQYGLSVEPQKDEQTDLEYLATTFIDAVRECFKAAGFAKVENEREEGGLFLVGYRGRVYRIESNFQVNSSRDGYSAIGSGEYYALGNMYNTSGLEPRERITKALEAASHLNKGVCPPFYLIGEQRKLHQTAVDKQKAISVSLPGSPVGPGKFPMWRKV